MPLLHTNSWMQAAKTLQPSEMSFTTFAPKQKNLPYRWSTVHPHFFSCCVVFACHSQHAPLSRYIRQGEQEAGHEAAVVVQLFSPEIKPCMRNHSYIINKVKCEIFSQVVINMNYFGHNRVVQIWYRDSPTVFLQADTYFDIWPFKNLAMTGRYYTFYIVT